MFIITLYFVFSFFNHHRLLYTVRLYAEDMRVWLLEVNHAPSLVATTRRRGCVSEVHHALKAGLVADVLNLVDAAGLTTEAGFGFDAAVAAEVGRAALGKFKPLRFPH